MGGANRSDRSNMDRLEKNATQAAWILPNLWLQPHRQHLRHLPRMRNAVSNSGGRRPMRKTCPTCGTVNKTNRQDRSEEHTSELQSPHEISHAVFSLKK